MHDLLSTPLLEIRGVPFEVALKSGASVSGTLMGIDPESASFLIRREARPSVEKIAFPLVRYISMKGEMTADVRRELLSKLPAERLNPSDRTVITFSDKVQLEFGPGYFKRDKGFHLYQFPEGNAYLRIFIPAEAVEQIVSDAVVDNARVAAFEWARPVISERAELGRYMELLLLSHNVKIIPQRRRLAEVLLHDRVVTTDQVREALVAQGKNRNRRIGELLVESGVVSEDELFVSLAHQLRVPFVRLRNFDFPNDVDKYLKAEVARNVDAVPLMDFRGNLIVALADPIDSEAQNLLRFASGKPVLSVLATHADIKWALEKIYSGVDFSQTLRQLASRQEDDKFVIPLDAELKESDEPLVRLVNDLLTEAIRKRVSDVHLRPGETQLDLLYRIDGSMVPVSAFPNKIQPAIMGRLKIMGNMDISEKRRPQDGQIRFKTPDGQTDMRVSILPTVNGESVCIRVLASKASLKAIDQLGFSEKDLDHIKEMLDKSFGMFLVTGPTGSGKSTTLYSCLRELRSKNLNIITVEDPVEFRIDGIEQVQSRADIGFTFAMALRQILRHDPDAILIGEIRDQETAEIAVKSALTGHLVLSTLHTNNAVGAITRLQDIGIPSYLLSSCILGVQAQRLIRTNCLSCMDEEPVDALVRRVMGVSHDELFMRGRGCDECNGTGYKGRTSVYELLRITPALQIKINSGAKAEELAEQAYADGMMPLTRNALELARLYKTSLDEAYHVRLD